MSILRHLDKAQVLQFIKGATGGVMIGNPHSVRRILHRQIDTAIVFAIVERHQFHQQRPCIRA